MFEKKKNTSIGRQINYAGKHDSTQSDYLFEILESLKSSRNDDDKPSSFKSIAGIVFESLFLNLV